MLSFKKEKQVVELVWQHAAIIDNCLKKTRETLESYFSGDMEAMRSVALEVNALESEADTIKRTIRDVLYSGAYLPAIRSDIYRLVFSVDSVAGKAEDCANFLASQLPVIPEEFQAEFAEIFTIAVACFYEFTRALKTFLKPKGKFEKLQERSDRVGQLESEADAKELEMMRRIFASDIDYAVKLHLAQFLRISAEITDVTEYAANNLMFAALKSRI